MSHYNPRGSKRSLYTSHQERMQRGNISIITMLMMMMTTTYNDDSDGNDSDNDDYDHHDETHS